MVLVLVVLCFGSDVGACGGGIGVGVVAVDAAVVAVVAAVAVAVVVAVAVGNISRLSAAGTPTPSQPSSARRRSSRGADGHDGSANHSGGDANYFSSNLADRPFDSPNAAAVRSSLSTPHDAAEKYDYAEAVDDGTVTSVESELSGVCCSLAA